MQHHTEDIQRVGGGRKRHGSWSRIVASVVGLAVVVGSLTMLGYPSAADGNGGRAATAADLKNRSFAFSNGAVFSSRLGGAPVTLLFGDFNGTATGPFRLSSGNSTAIGRARLTSCNLVVTSS